MIGEKVASALLSWPHSRAEDGLILVPTHCLYPSHSCVTVAVGGAVDSLFVSDRWGAYEEVSEAGGNFTPSIAAHVLRHIVGEYGLSIDQTCLIKADRVSSADLMSTIVLVSNASRDASNQLLNRFRPRLRRNIKAELANMLELRFPHLVIKDKYVVGASNKAHKFDTAVRLPGDRQLVLDVVTREASSINAALVAHLDIKNARIANLEQRIVYDDLDKWSSSDLTLLSIGATPVPYSQAEGVFERLAA